MTDESPQAGSAVQARPATDPAVRYFIAAVVLIGFGLWCLADMKSYPYRSYSEDINAYLAWAFNHFGAIGFPLVGLIPLVKGLLQLRRKLTADDTGLTVGSRRIAYDQVAQLDASRFRTKGLLTLRLKDQSDLVLDTWHYRREEFREIVRVLEQKVPVVVGSSGQ